MNIADKTWKIQRSKTNALFNWQEQVIACRNARLETEEQAWQRSAAWYENWVRHNDYVQITLPRLSPFIHSGARILEIGPGTGAFTLPIARRARQVVAVEPSPHIREILKHNLAATEITNVEIISHPIETALEHLTEPFDLAFASFSLYNVMAIDAVIEGLLRVANWTMVLIGTGEPLPWRQDLNLRWRKNPLVTSPQLPQFFALLAEMGIYPDVQIYYSSYNYVFETEEALVDWWWRYFHLGEEQREALRVSLLPLVERRGSQIGVFSQSRLALVSIERGRNWSKGN
jgi:SAM-dependent methyltransferase